jgi:hypothetical protein
MAHEINWLKPNHLLYVSYQGHQTVETVTSCLDDMAVELDQADHPVIVLISWLEVTEMDPKALLSTRGHRTFSHPLAARGVLVGMPTQAAFENEVSVTTTRQSKNTQYYATMEEARDYLRDYLAEDAG